MRISDIRREGPARFAATVIWEDSDRPRREVYFETDDELGKDLREDPNVFLSAAYFPAIRHGEKRLALEGAVSPRLWDGLRSIAALFRSWYGSEGRDEVSVEPARGFVPTLPRVPARAASFISGGIDSLFTLRKNRLEIPPDHPASIRDLLWIVGREFPGDEDSPDALRRSRRMRELLGEVARDSGATLVPVRTNIRLLDPDLVFFGYEFQGAYIASAAHALAARLNVVSFSSGWDIGHLIPWGTHPLVDSNFATEGVDFRHAGLLYGRADKLRAIGDWDVGVRSLVVCNEGSTADSANCGRCYKCIETKTLLLSEGLLPRAGEFPGDVTPAMIESLTLAPNLRSSFAEYSGFWAAMLPDLEARGRSDLAAAIRAKLDDARRLEAWLRERDWKGLLKRADRRFSGGLGLRALRAIRGR